MDAPGEMIDIGGRRLHLLRRGDGFPTVVIEASGGGGSSPQDWPVLNRVARFTHVLSYDRAGLGWSDPSPAPKTFDGVADDLDALLASAGETPPFVMVGGSFGGLLVRAYCRRYLANVAGAILYVTASGGRLAVGASGAGVLANAAKNPTVRTVVLGMHAALPDSTSAGHSMNDSAQEQASGRKVYNQLAAFRKSTKKNVYVLASHSHFVMNNVYDTACHKDDVLPGWIMGSAGAVRYRLPPDSGISRIARTDIYGYLLGTVAADGTITFEFKDIKESDVPASVVNEFSREQVDWCFAHNTSDYTPAGPICDTGQKPASGQ